MAFDEIAGHPNGVKEIRQSSKPGLPSRRKDPPKPDLDPINSNWVPKNMQIRAPEMGPRFWVLPSVFLIGGPENGSRLRPQKWVRDCT